MKHTPGPWLYNQDEGTIYVHGCPLAEIIAARSAEEIEGNAQLIAAAPDLLEGCKIAIDAMCDYANFTGHKKAEIQKLKRIVAKAMGEKAA